MSETKRYYWLKLKSDFFDDETIKYIEEQDNGIKYSNFYLKLCLKSLKTDGKLIRLVGETLIPYDITSLARLTSVDFDTVRSAMQLFEKIGLIKILETGEIYLQQIDEMIGSETDKAQIMRRSRAEKKMIGNNVSKMLPKCYTEIEKEREKEKEIDVVVEEKQQQLQKLFINCTSSTNLNAIQECISYLDDLPYEVIEIALKKTSEKNGGWKYAKTILQNWLKAGIKTIEQVQAEELNFKSNKGKKELTKEAKEQKLKERIERAKKRLEEQENWR